MTLLLEILCSFYVWEHTGPTADYNDKSVETIDFLCFLDVQLMSF